MKKVRRSYVYGDKSSKLRKEISGALKIVSAFQDLFSILRKGRGTLNWSSIFQRPVCEEWMDFSKSFFSVSEKSFERVALFNFFFPFGSGRSIFINFTLKIKYIFLCFPFFTINFLGWKSQQQKSFQKLCNIPTSRKNITFFVKRAKRPFSLQQMTEI